MHLQIPLTLSYSVASETCRSGAATWQRVNFLLGTDPFGALSVKSCVPSSHISKSPKSRNEGVHLSILPGVTDPSGPQWRQLGLRWCNEELVRATLAHFKGPDVEKRSRVDMVWVLVFPCDASDFLSFSFIFANSYQLINRYWHLCVRRFHVVS